MVPIPEFSEYFRSLWGCTPFPWQRMLAEHLLKGGWPKTLDIPTAAGKTACIDIALYALAAQADKPVWERTAPRRIWFVVDRRIVVDEAFARTEQIAEKLASAQDGPLKAVADRLLQISGTQRPLATARLRGGVLRDDGWARLPSQPAVITSTVDQLGSRLLFRGYGHSPRTAPIFAGLAAHDSLILLDEAHLSVPFLQTLRAVQRYRSPEWAQEPIRTPFAFTMLSATPPADVPPDDCFPGAARDAALDHPVLHQRMQAAKPADLVEVKASKPDAADPLVVEAAARSRAFVDQGAKRAAVVVNRVATAQAVSQALQDVLGEHADVVLFTGRLRPLERDALVNRWAPRLRANDPVATDKPIILVATQCIEVGADFSFDALVAEAASLDAMRQRFGRLNRLGEVERAPAAILIRADEAKQGAEDPIYGTAMTACWELLNGLAEVQGEGKRACKAIDLGIEALDRSLEAVGDLARYLAPAPDAPTLLPAHLDLLCQTAPVPAVSPDITLYLHGTDRGPPEVRVVWRADLDPERTNDWLEIVGLCPPSSLESLSVPLYRLRQWLAGGAMPDGGADVEGAAWDEKESPARHRARPALAWRGREGSQMITRPSDLRPNDLVVLPAAYGMEGLGQSAPAAALGPDRLDLWEPARRESGRSPALRLHWAVLGPWRDRAPLAELLDLAEGGDWDRDTLQTAIDAVLQYAPETEDEPAAVPNWLKALLEETRTGKVEQHPTGGLVLFAPPDKRRPMQEQDLFADDDDLLSVAGEEVALDVHSASVERAVEQLAARCLPESFHEPLKAAAYWHDAGKLDERFQLWLRQGNELDVYSGTPLAKSKEVPASPTRRRRLREASGLPQQFRHEMLSLQLAERYALLPNGDGPGDLMLHAISSHHGHARPFAPVSPDPDPPPVRSDHDGVDIAVDQPTRADWPAPHALASGTAERFWHLNRRYGWWGLAYLEAILRLGDWYGSQWVVDDSLKARSQPVGETAWSARRPKTANQEGLVLTGIDGTNPLSFLTAVGTLAVLHQAGYRDARLVWHRCGLVWRPELSGLPSADRASLAGLIADGLAGAEMAQEAQAARSEAQKRMDQAAKKIKDKRDEIKRRKLRGKEQKDALEKDVAPLEREHEALRHQWLKALRRAVPRPELALGKHIDCTADEYRDHVASLTDGARWDARESLDLFAAFASDACLHENDQKRKKGVVGPTPFCFVTGSGHQYFLDFVRQLLEHVDTGRIEATLFEPWTYGDEGLSLRWDPLEARRYALMDRDPKASDNKARTEWMANLLAYRALVLFPSAPRHKGLVTTGWVEHESAQSFTWPLWTHPAGPDAVRSLLLLPQLCEPTPDRPTLRARGVKAAYRANRIKVGTGANFKVNFSPAREV